MPGAEAHITRLALLIHVLDPELHILVLLVLLCLGRIIILLCLFDLRFFIRNILFQNVQICQKGDQLGVQFIDLILGLLGILLQIGNILIDFIQFLLRLTLLILQILDAGRVYRCLYHHRCCQDHCQQTYSFLHAFHPLFFILNFMYASLL